MTPRDPRRVGWLIVAFGAISLGVLGAYLGIEFEGIDPSDPGWAEVAWIVGPILAAGGSLVIGVVLMMVAALRLIDVALSRAAKATGLGCIGAPIVYLSCLLLLANSLDSLDANGAWQALAPLLISALPIGVGIATVLGYVVGWPRWASRNIPNP
jgi:hypothetical protein